MILGAIYLIGLGILIFGWAAWAGFKIWSGKKGDWIDHPEWMLGWLVGVLWPLLLPAAIGVYFARRAKHAYSLRAIHARELEEVEQLLTEGEDK